MNSQPVHDPDAWLRYVMSTIHQCVTCDVWMIGTLNPQCRDCCPDPVQVREDLEQPSLFGSREA